MATAIRRLAEEDPTLRLRRDQQTGEEILSGMSQMHVEVALERAKRRFGVDIDSTAARAVPGDDPQGGARTRSLQEADRWSRPVRRRDGRRLALPGRRVRVRRQDRRRRDPAGLPARGRQGIQEAMHHGELAGAPVQGVRVELVDGSYHTVDSSEMAFESPARWRGRTRT